MISSARRSSKRRACSAIINCFAHKYDTASMTKYEGDHCEKQEGGCQNSTTCSVEYSNLGSTTDGAEPSRPAAYYAKNTGPLVHETTPVPRILAWCHHRS